MFSLKTQLFSLYSASFVFSPARYFVLRVRSLPLTLSVFSTTALMFLFCFRILSALFLFPFSCFRTAMLPMTSKLRIIQERGDIDLKIYRASFISFHYLNFNMAQALLP